MKISRRFSQGKLIADYENLQKKQLCTSGICFRVTFKWAACMFFGGEFKYEELNVVKTANKHVQYRDKTLNFSREKQYFDDATFEYFVKIDGEEALRFINQWGLEIKDAHKIVYHGLDVVNRMEGSKLCDYLKNSGSWKTETLIHGFYGRRVISRNLKPAGHAVAFHGPNRWFFDTNYGLFDFSSQDGEKIGQEIEAHLNIKYGSFSHERFSIYLLGKK